MGFKYGVCSIPIGFGQAIFRHVVTLNDDIIVTFPYAAHLVPPIDDANDWMSLDQPDPIELFGRHFLPGDISLLMKTVDRTGLRPGDHDFAVALRLLSA
jgi:hypothetical protein